MAEPESEHAPGMITVEVAYALPDQQVLLAFEVEEGTTAREAIERSGILEQHPEIELMKQNKIGVFGKLVKPDQVLREGDRVEIYRPLIADPKEVRRQRAKEGKKTRKGGGEAESAGAEAAGEGGEGDEA